MTDTLAGNTERPGWYDALTQSLARQADDPTARFVQLATTSNGPANRTIVFRGFGEPGVSLLFVTDCRSSKVAQIRAEPVGSICWYLQKTREQYRLSGPLQVVDGDARDPGAQEQRRRLWLALSESTRAQFAWPTPGTPRTDAPPSAPERSVAQPPATFCMLLLDPVKVDHLRVDATPHRRMTYERAANGAWHCEEINP